MRHAYVTAAIDSAKVRESAAERAKEGISTTIHYHSYNVPCPGSEHDEVKGE